MEKRLQRRRDAPEFSTMGQPGGKTKFLGTITCRRCGTEDDRFTFAYAGLRSKFMRYLDVTECTNCGYLWVDPIHYVVSVDCVDYMRPERVLVLAKYRMQTQARDLMYNLCNVQRQTIRDVQNNHFELVKGMVQEFSSDSRHAGALGRRHTRLVKELLRYGNDAFPFVEGHYYGWTRAHLFRRLAIHTNDLINSMRAAFKIAQIPRERVKFMAMLESMKLRVLDEIVAEMKGWTLRRRDVKSAFSALSVTVDQLKTYYNHMFDNIGADLVAAGSNFTAILTRGGSLWTCGDGHSGRLGHGHDAPYVRPQVVLMARPKHEGVLSNSYRIFVRQANAWYNCDVGIVLSNVQRGAVLYFDKEVVPPQFIGVRFRVRSHLDGSNATLKADGVDGTVLASATIPATPTAPDGEPQWMSIEAPVVNQTHQEPRTLVLQFGDDDACEMEWFEFFA